MPLLAPQLTLYAILFTRFDATLSFFAARDAADAALLIMLRMLMLRRQAALIVCCAPSLSGAMLP